MVTFLTGKQYPVKIPAKAKILFELRGYMIKIFST